MRELPEVAQSGTAGALVCSRSFQRLSCAAALQLWGGLPFLPRWREGEARTLSLSLGRGPSPWANPVNREQGPRRRRTGVFPVKARVAPCSYCPAGRLRGRDLLPPSSESSAPRVAEGEGEERAQPPAPPPSLTAVICLGKSLFFSAQEKILVVPITRKTKSSAGHQRLPEAENNVQGAQWSSPSWEAEGEQREDTGPGLSGRRGRGMTDRGTWKKDFPPKTLKSRLLSYIREMIQDLHTSLSGSRPPQLRSLSPPLLPPGPQPALPGALPRGHPSSRLLALSAHSCFPG